MRSCCGEDRGGFAETETGLSSYRPLLLFCTPLDTLGDFATYIYIFSFSEPFPLSDAGVVAILLRLPETV